MKIIDIREQTLPISSPIRNAYIDFSKMTLSLVAVITDVIRDGQGKIFSEDLQMLESQQRNLLRMPQRKLLSLNIDAGGVQSRRVIDRYLALEPAN